VNELLLSLKRTTCVQWSATAILGLLCLALVALNFKLAADLSSLAHHQPIHVIPGAAEGVYAAGLTRYNVANAARYLLGLAVNLTPATAAQRFSELEGYIAPEALGEFRTERDQRLKEIKTQQQSRAFYPDAPDHLSVENGIYRYRVRGVWEIRSGSLPMSLKRHEFTLHFRVGGADRENPYGVFIDAFEVRALEELAADRPHDVAVSP
jgi:hypothetical protein